MPDDGDAVPVAVPVRFTTEAAADEPTLGILRVASALAQVFPGDQYRQHTYLAIALCESGADPTNRIIDVDGLLREGPWSVGEKWWGPVPSDPVEQVRQVQRIVEGSDTTPAYGWAPWSCGGAVRRYER